MKKAIVIAALALAGCASFLHFADPTAQAVSCAVTPELVSVIESVVDSTGIPLPVLETLYGDACADAAKMGLGQHDAEQAAMDALRERAVRLAQLHARFDDAGAP